MNYKLEEISCNLCGNSDTEKISDKGQFDLPISLVLCKNCGLGYLNPRWNEAGYLDFYQNHYDRYYRPELKGTTKIPNHQDNILVKRLIASGHLKTDEPSILDIGSGPGKNLMALKHFFPKSRLFAIEPSEESCRVMEKNGVTIVSKDVNADWIKGGGARRSLT